MDSLRTFFLYAAWLYGLALLVQIARRVRHAGMYAVCVLATCYPVGKFFQGLGVGPGWLRHHVNDIGFVPCLVLLMMATRSGWLTRQQRVSNFKSMWVIPFVLGVTGTALLFEIWQNDPIDGVLEIISSVATVALLKTVPDDLY